MNTILSEDVGHFLLLGVVLFMAQVVTFLVKAESKWLGTRETSEYFSRAGRNIKTVLIASSDRTNRIVSCIGLDLSGYLVTIIAYQFEISRAFWYAAEASILVLLIAIEAIELK